MFVIFADSVLFRLLRMTLCTLHFTCYFTLYFLFKNHFSFLKIYRIAFNAMPLEANATNIRSHCGSTFATSIILDELSTFMVYNVFIRKRMTIIG